MTAPKALRKTLTGIHGLDEITGGGLPQGRPSLVCGGPGSGKTLLGMEFLVRGAQEFGEPGVFMSFEETAAELSINVASLGYDVDRLIRTKKLAIDHVHVERREIEETGEYDLEGLFVRLGLAIDELKAKRVVLDSLEALFAGLPNEAILRSELRRLFRWLKDKGVTAIITAEQGKETLTRHGLEEYVSDCVIFLDHRVVNQVATRRLRVVKYRGTSHGTNEYPTLIDQDGLSVLPISSIDLNYGVTKERVSTGNGQLDEMLGGKGYFRGSSVLISGTAGTGKTSLAVSFIDSICQKGQRAMYFSFEESQEQILRNMVSIGIDLQRHVRKGLLKFHSVRSTIYGLEQHLVAIHNLVNNFKPSAIVIDPITNLGTIGNAAEIKSMFTRVIDFFKNQGITTVFTSLFREDQSTAADTEVSSLMDTWIQVQQTPMDTERRRFLYVLKSRGMAHSNKIREFILSNKGIQLIDSSVIPVHGKKI